MPLLSTEMLLWGADALGPMGVRYGWDDRRHGDDGIRWDAHADM